MSPWTKERRGCEITSARFSRFPAYVSASSETTSYGVARSMWRTKFEEMNPAPPVTSTRFTLIRAPGRSCTAGRPSTSRWILPRYSPTRARMKPWMPSTNRTATPPKSGPGKFDAVDPVDDAVDAERGGDERAEHAERHADPLDRLRPEAREHVEREAGEPERRVARPPWRGAWRTSTSTTLAPPERTSAFVNFCLPITRQHRRHDVAAVRVERAAEVRDRRRGEAAQHPVDQPRGQRPAPRVVPGGAPAAGDVDAGLDRGDEPRDVLRRVLEVAVHRHDDLAAGANEPRVHRRMLAEVASKRIARTRWSRSCSRVIVAHVASVEPSSTKTSSNVAAARLEGLDRPPVELFEVPAPR